MRLIRKILIAAFIAIMGITATGCKSDNVTPPVVDPGNGGGSQSSQIGETELSEYESIDGNGNYSYRYPQGIHEGSISSTDDMLVINGKTDYKIVLPGNYTDYEKIAANELVLFFREATGIKLPIVYDNEVSYSSASKFLCIGNVSFLTDAGVVIPDDVNLSGYILQTKGKSVFMAGGLFGNVNAVYEFLYRAFGYEYYQQGVYSLNKGVSNLELKNYSIKEAPDISLRACGYGTVGDNESQMRMKISYTDNFINPEGKGVHHTAFTFINPEIYNDPGKPETYHPEYFSSDGTQLSYTGNGDPEAVKEMQQIVLEKLKQYITDNPDVPSIEFSQRDYNTWSNDDASVELRKKYGTDAASQILFINPVARELKEWLRETYPGREVQIVMFAYMSTVDAPVKKEGDKYVPIDESMILEDNVSIYYAPIEADFTRSFDEGINRGVKENFLAWSTLCKKIYFWNYSVYFGNYFLPFNDFNCMQQIYQFAQEIGVYYIFDQGAYSQGKSTAWTALKAYLHCKLMWNSYYDIDRCIRNYFNNVYGEASEAMTEIFNAQRMWFTYLQTQTDYAGSSCVLSSLMQNPKYWPQGILESWINMYDNAYKAIESIKETNEKLYQKYYDAINLESLSPRYLLLSNYGTNLSSSLRKDMVDELYQDVEYFGIYSLAEGVSTQNLKESLLG